MRVTNARRKREPAKLKPKVKPKPGTPDPVFARIDAIPTRTRTPKK